MLLQEIRDLGPLYLLGFLAVSLVLWFVLAPLYVNNSIRRFGGVRAHVHATNPLTGLPWFIRAGIKYSQDDLLSFFQHELFASAPKESPHCAEISVTGRLRYIFTREPEHIKTVLTSKFSDFGKGWRFHQLWSPFLGDSIFTTDGNLWQDSRGLIRPVFVREKVSDLLIFEKWTQALLSKLPSSGQTVHMQDLFYRMTLDVTTDFLLGSSVNSLDK